MLVGPVRQLRPVIGGLEEGGVRSEVLDRARGKITDYFVALGMQGTDYGGSGIC